MVDERLASTDSVRPHILCGAGYIDDAQQLNSDWQASILHDRLLLRCALYPRSAMILLAFMILVTR